MEYVSYPLLAKNGIQCSAQHHAAWKDPWMKTKGGSGLTKQSAVPPPR